MIGYVGLVSSVFIFNTSTLLPIGNAALVTGFIFIAYGIVGAVMAFQGKTFRYWLIGNQVEQAMPSIMEHKSVIYILFAGITIVCMLILLGVYIMAAIGQANARGSDNNGSTIARMKSTAEEPPNTASCTITRMICTRPSGEHQGHGGGSRRVFKQFAHLEVGSGKMALSCPAHQRVPSMFSAGPTHTVGRLSGD